MSEVRVVASRDGNASATVEGEELVCRRVGQRRTRMFGPMEPWSDEVRVPLAVACATIDRVNSETDRKELRIRQGERAVFVVSGLDLEEMERFIAALDAARLRANAPPAPVAACSHCGAPGQRVGQPCGYCGIAVSAPIRT